eukprot:CAMPEP_0113939942 /NCGR_PEP_ID=MMETSP1339-20121228/6152_1 /TAXON_ID=94617 /ORGANISM="Fibrocapsa japonica" /LENGTH=500 /DNA_ID=CAMNT_0000943591 /DNA_START=79 /DNA_END=1578 /DNA_ORIENTATION=- /assembly_acc=CAM_ASM_000762
MKIKILCRILILALFSGAMICQAFRTAPLTRLLVPATTASREAQLRLMSSSSPPAAGRSSAAVQQQASGKKKQQKALDLAPPRGTRDFYPADMRLRQWLHTLWRDTARQFGFQEYDAPVLENEPLYTRKSGEEVTQQLYGFEDKGGRRVALRPEMTPSLARMVLAKKGGLQMPIKWFSTPQCWRYERMTRGRRREHFQWNMDIWGLSGVEAEAELLGAMVSFLMRAGLSSADVGIKVNSRAVLGEVLTSLGVPEESFAATCVLVDKLEKVKLEDIQGELEGLGLTEEIITRLVEVMANKDLDKIAEVVGEDSQALQDLRQLFRLGEAYGYNEWLVFDASVVRGLAYYTGVVFEAFDREGALRAIAGGGRYDRLLETFGAKEPIPAAGFGFGDAVVVELLKDRGLLPDFETPETDCVVFAMDPSLQADAIKVASKLREAGRGVDLVLDERKAKWAFKHADRLGAKFLVMLASDEHARGEVSVKNLQNREQSSVKTEEVSEW